MFPTMTVFWRVNEERLKQDGWSTPFETVDDRNTPSDVIVRENNLLFLVSPTTGQKTGFYCDQVMKSCCFPFNIA